MPQPICSNCNASIAPKANFCKSCGKEVWNQRMAHDMHALIDGFAATLAEHWEHSVKIRALESKIKGDIRWYTIYCDKCHIVLQVTVLPDNWAALLENSSKDKVMTSPYMHGAIA